MHANKFLTTGQAARYCHVSQTTIINWIRKGKLKAYATPGGHHRILLPDFLSFMDAYRIPVDAALRESARPQVLIVSDGPQAEALAQALRAHERFEIACAHNDHEAGAEATRLKPDAIVLDTRSKALNWATLCEWLRASPDGEVLVVLAVGDPEDEPSAQSAGADAYLTGDAITEKLESQLRALLDQNGRG